MPIVKKVSTCFADQPLQRITKFDPKSGDFSIALPDFAQGVLGMREVKAKTLAEVEDAWREAHETYRQCQSTKKRVIAYHWACNLDVVSEPCDDDLGGRRVLFAKHITFAKYAQMHLSVAVYDETCTTLPDRTKRYRYDLVRDGDAALPCSIGFYGRDGGPNDYDGEQWRDQMDWTVERHAFFARMAIGLERMIMELDAAFTKDGMLEQIADGGKPLFLTK